MKQTSNADAGAVSQMQAFAEKVRDGIADYIADNMADRKHSIAEIDAYIRAIEINADRLAPTAEQAEGVTIERIHEIASSYMEADTGVYVSFLPSNLDKFASVLLAEQVGTPQTSPQDMQWEAHLAEVVEHTIDTLGRQLDLISERAPGAFLDKTPVVRSLTAHKQRLERALAERNASFAAPSASDGDQEVGS